MKILVADDCQDTVESFTTLLGDEGYEVCSASSGTAAVALAMTQRPAIALLDIGMPDGDGFVVAARLRALFPEMLLVAVTGWQSSSATAEELARFDYYLLKPIEIEKVVSLLTEYQLRGELRLRSTRT
jgi:CheY-like chemotaxis protein